jgi:hypothetical protein
MTPPAPRAPLGYDKNELTTSWYRRTMRLAERLSSGSEQIRLQRTDEYNRKYFPHFKQNDLRADQRNAEPKDPNKGLLTFTATTAIGSCSVVLR